MTTIQVEELQHDLLGYLQRVRGGESIVVQDGEVVLAHLGPPPADIARSPEDEGLPGNERYSLETRRLAAQGVLRLPEEPMTDEEWEKFLTVKLPKPKVSDEAVREALDWARDDRF